MEDFMKIKYCFQALLLMVGLTMTLAQAGQGARSEERLNQAFPLSSGGELKIENYKGRIEIVAANTNEVQIDATKYVVGGNDSARNQWLRDVQVRFSNSANQVTVRVEYPTYNYDMSCP